VLAKGYLAFVLHAHLPYIHHPEYEDFLEEDWLFEAISETYLPLLAMLERLRQDRVPTALTLALSPPLCAMLREPLLQARFLRRLELHAELANKELARTAGDERLQRVILFYQKRIQEQIQQYQGLQRDIVGAFASFQRAGMVEICTCAATHAFLPLMANHPIAVKAQITTAVKDYTAVFGREPRGIWLPECGYYPGLDAILAEAGLRFFFLDTHGIEQAVPRPVHGVYAPIYTPSGVAAFGREMSSSLQVWSAKEGYPGNPMYRDFYRDIGFDLPLEVVRPYIQPTGARKMTGFKYHRITGEIEEKELYDPDAARARALEDAEDFVQTRLQHLHALSAQMQRKPLVVAPYDAELFGHWWFEGPIFLEQVIRLVAQYPRDIELTTPPQYLTEQPRQQIAQPPYSSWGAQGHAQVWLDPTNDWIYPHLHHATLRMISLATEFPNATGEQEDALNQMARELLLAQASDWAFIMKTGTAVQYAIRRSRDHLLRARKLYEQLRVDLFESSWLKEIQRRDAIFPDLDYRIYARPKKRREEEA
jgi:1,4-alpha-glucan branching enzyme